MSLLDLSRFSYQRRKKECFLKSGKENKCSTQTTCVTTPNKAPAGSDFADVNSIPETPPDSPELCVSSERIGIPNKRRRSEHSSSEDESIDSGNLFSGLKFSKRRKRDPDQGAVSSDSVIQLSENYSERNEVINLSSDDELNLRRSTLPNRKSDHRSRARKLLDLGRKRADAALKRCSASAKRRRGGASGRVGETTNGWRRRSTRRENRDGEVRQLSEMFPQHTEEYLHCTLEQCASFSEAVAMVLAAADSDHKQRESPRRRPSQRYRRCKLLDSDESPSTSLPTSKGNDSEGGSCPASVAGASGSRHKGFASGKPARRPRRLCVDSPESDSEKPHSHHKTTTAICIESTDDERELDSPLSITVVEGDCGSQRRRLCVDSPESDSEKPQSHHKTTTAICIDSTDDEGELDSSLSITVVEGDCGSQRRSCDVKSSDTTTAGRFYGRSGTTHSRGAKLQKFGFQMRDNSGNGSLTTPSHGAGQETVPIDLEALERQCGRERDLSDSDDDGYSPLKKRAILEFFNRCCVAEACSISGCSATKARLIVSNQPFDSWMDLMKKVTSRNPKLLAGCIQLLAERKVMAKLLSECQKISGTIQGLVSQLQESKELSPQVCFSQPSILNPSLQLKPYQLVGLSWLALLHSQHLNGILADEMGLGKTIQAIAFLAHLREKGCRGPFLIVVPCSTLDNWARELEVWCPTLRVLIYWGSQEERLRIRCEVLEREEELEYEVILSTYNICIGVPEDRRFLRKLSLHCLVLDEGHMLKNMASLRYAHLMKIKAQCRLLLTGTPLQNTLMELISLLSFIMPNVFQEYSEQLKKAFSRAKTRLQDESSAYYRQQVEQAKQIMQPFILRRLKSEVLSQLPAKLEQVESCPLTAYQQQLYSATVESARRSTDLEQHSRSMEILMELRKVANHPLLLRHHYCQDQLREMAQEILKEPSHKDADPNLVFEDMEVMSDFELHNLCLVNQSLSRYTLSPDVFRNSGKFEFLARKLKQLKEESSRVLLFSQFVMMLDVMEVFLQQEGHTYLRLDGKTPVTESCEIEAGEIMRLTYRQHDQSVHSTSKGKANCSNEWVVDQSVISTLLRQPLIDQYNQNPDILVFLLSTRAGPAEQLQQTWQLLDLTYNTSHGMLHQRGLGINLTSANVVIIHDIDFNPHNDKQAEDRCHRVGQKRDVHVIRLISHGTIEEDMLQCTHLKLKLEQDITLADELSASDIASLLKKSINTANSDDSYI